MMSRFRKFDNFEKHNRKLFSSVQKRIIACDQAYMCVGTVCNGKILLPSTWELDHINPLYKGGSNFYNFYKDSKKDHLQNNLQILCPNCHAIKTQQEKVEFYQIERREKYGDSCVNFDQAKYFYNPIPCISPYFKNISPPLRTDKYQAIQKLRLKRLKMNKI